MRKLWIVFLLAGIFCACGNIVTNTVPNADADENGSSGQDLGPAAASDTSVTAVDENGLLPPDLTLLVYLAIGNNYKIGDSALVSMNGPFADIFRLATSSSSQHTETENNSLGGFGIPHSYRTIYFDTLANNVPMKIQLWMGLMAGFGLKGAEISTWQIDYDGDGIWWPLYTNQIYISWVMRSKNTGEIVLSYGQPDSGNYENSPKWWAGKWLIDNFSFSNYSENYTLEFTLRDNISAFYKGSWDGHRSIVTPVSTQTNVERNNFIKALYGYFLGRDPDLLGFTNWNNACATIPYSRVRDGFIDSVEYKNRVSNQEFINFMYAWYLNRVVSQGETFGWVGNLDSGQWSRSMVMNAFLDSDEAISKTSNMQFVRNLYAYVLAREPDAGGLNTWVNQLNNGSKRSWVRDAILNSDEFKNRNVLVGNPLPFKYIFDFPGR